MELIGLYLVAALLLLVAGPAKAIRPCDTARALGATLRLPSAPLVPLVRLVAVGEAVLGALALAWPGPVAAALVAASYLFFAALLVAIRGAGGAIASCGCFGRPDTPVTVPHVLIDVLLGVAAAAVAVAAPSGSLLRVLAAQPWHGFPLVAASLLCTWLCVLVMDQLSRLVAVRRLAGIAHPRRA